jgi:hypothetical protein
LATQIQEPKMKVLPSSSTVLVKLRDAIKFSGGCTMNDPTWGRQLLVFYCHTH